MVNNNKAKHIVDDKKGDTDRYYLKEIKVMHSSHLTNVKKMTPTSSLNENSAKFLCSSIGSDSRKEQLNIAITQVDLITIAENYAHVQTKHKKNPLKLLSELIDLQIQIEQHESKLSSTSEKLTSMIGMFEREEDE